MSSPKITKKAAQAPFRIEWKIDASELHFAERKALMDALKLEVFSMKQEPWHAFAEDRSTLIAMDATEAVIEQLSAVCKRFERRHEIKAETYTLPKIPLCARLAAWLNPKHTAPIALKRLANVCKVDGRYQFEIELHSTDADLHFIKIMKGVIASPSCRGASIKIRGRLLTVKARHVEPCRKVWQCAQRINFDRVGVSTAICPVLLWVASLIPAGDD
tara:strand:+ start:1760 stop:2410 length:651 start_codon:yes stop_codon:yes gene_type:complete